MKYNIILVPLIFLNTVSFADDYREPLLRGKIKNIRSPSVIELSAIIKGNNIPTTLGQDDIPNNLGQGYYKTTDTITNTNGLDKNSYQVFVSQPQSSGGFSNISSYQEFTSSLGVNSTLKSSLFGVDLAAATSFENNIVNTNKTISFIYQFSKTAIISAKPANVRFRLTAQASNALRKAITAQNMGDNEPMRQFESDYGTSFIASEEIGAKVYVMLTFNYATQYAKQSFTSKLEGKHGLHELMAELSYNSSASNLVSNLSVSYLQLGGIPNRLAGVFSDRDGEFQQCLSKEFSSCASLFTEVSRYIAEDLDEQLADGSHYFRFGVKDQIPYYQIAYNDGSPVGDFDSDMTSKELKNIRKEIYNQAVRICWESDALKDVIHSIAPSDIQLISKMKRYQQSVTGMINNHFQIDGYDLKSCLNPSAPPDMVNKCKAAYKAILAKWKSFAYKGDSPRLDRDLSTLSWSVVQYVYSQPKYYGEPVGKPFLLNGRLLQKTNYYYINNDGSLKFEKQGIVVSYEYNNDIDKALSPFIYGLGTIVFASGNHDFDRMKRTFEVYSTAQGAHTINDLGNRHYTSEGGGSSAFTFLPSTSLWQPEWVVNPQGDTAKSTCISSGRWWPINNGIPIVGVEGRLSFWYQTDKNLAAYRLENGIKELLWNSNPQWNSEYAIFKNGNLMLKNSAGQIFWQSGTPGADKLCIVPDGVIIKNKNGSLVWANGHNYWPG